MPKIEDHGFRPGEVVYLEIGSLEVASWCPDDKAQVPPTQVHLLIRLKGIDIPQVMRFKGPDTLGILIEQLTRYRREVWPDD